MVADDPAQKAQVEEKKKEIGNKEVKKDEAQRRKQQKKKLHETMDSHFVELEETFKKL